MFRKSVILFLNQLLYAFCYIFSSKIVIHVDVYIYIRVTRNKTLSDVLGCRKFVFLELNLPTSLTNLLRRLMDSFEKRKRQKRGDRTALRRRVGGRFLKNSNHSLAAAAPTTFTVVDGFELEERCR